MASFLSLPRELWDMMYEYCGFHMKGREIVTWGGFSILKRPDTEEGEVDNVRKYQVDVHGHR